MRRKNRIFEKGGEEFMWLKLNDMCGLNFLICHLIRICHLMLIESVIQHLVFKQPKIGAHQKSVKSFLIHQLS
jgi:hypothetical protein